MSDHTPEGASQIESLLADRRRIQEWLERLDDTGNKAPQSVRQRVRADYEGRLAEVVARLRGFTTNLTASLETLRNQQADLSAQKAEMEEAQAEAELRYAVGEFTEAGWEELKAETESRLDALEGELARVGEEIPRLEEVLGQVAPAEPAPARGRRDAQQPVRLPGDDIEAVPEDQPDVTLVPQGSTDDADIVVEPEPDADDAAALPGGGTSNRPFTVEAPRFTPKETPIPRQRERPAARTLRFPSPPVPESGAPSVDEMTFLKSVTLDSPASRERPAGPVRTAVPSAAGAKTLKCADCGAANRPTEWYCEKCGAELAAL